MPVMIAVSLLLWFFLRDKVISRVEGIIFFLLLVIYVIALFMFARKNRESAKDVIDAVPESDGKGFIFVCVGLIILGLAGLAGGAYFFVEGAVSLARRFNISEAVIGLTIVAFGTSLPELATSIISAMKGKDDISVGNIVGSNIFNILCIIGISASIRAFSVQNISPVDILVMLGSALVLLPFMITGRVLSRSEGFVLIVIYIAYTAYLWPK